MVLEMKKSTERNLLINQGMSKYKELEMAKEVQYILEQEIAVCKEDIKK